MLGLGLVLSLSLTIYWRYYSSTRLCLVLLRINSRHDKKYIVTETNIVV